MNENAQRIVSTTVLAFGENDTKFLNILFNIPETNDWNKLEFY